MNPDRMGKAFRRRFDELAAIGRDPDTGELNRLAWTDADAQARAWFHAEAAYLDLDVDVDRNGNCWAWWWPERRAAPADMPDEVAVAVGSHLDTVPDGGAYDGALGVVAALTAVDALQASGLRPGWPLAVVAWADEEGGRFGTPCFGSGLSAGGLAREAILDRRDAAGVRLRDALSGAGIDPAGIGPDPERLRVLAMFVELHVEQGRGLVHLGRPVGVGTGIWPHGRWRFELHGQTNHAGTTVLADRRDPMLAAAELVDAARAEAQRHDAIATVGRVTASPGATNAVPGFVQAWLDARAPDDNTLDRLVAAIEERTRHAADASAVRCDVVQESAAAGVLFDEALRARLEECVAGHDDRPPRLATAAGHDAGALAARMPTGMLYVRNPTGVSHSPAEHADDDDCVAGIAALTTVLRTLLA